MYHSTYLLIPTYISTTCYLSCYPTFVLLTIRSESRNESVKCMVPVSVDAFVLKEAHGRVCQVSTVSVREEASGICSSSPQAQKRVFEMHVTKCCVVSRVSVGEKRSGNVESEKREVVMCNREESLKCMSPNVKFSCLVLEKREVLTCNNQPQSSESFETPVIKRHVVFLGLVVQRRDVLKCNG